MLKSIAPLLLLAIGMLSFQTTTLAHDGAGRADDYHYHIPPAHLEKTVGKGKPLAWALDGYPTFGFQEKGDADYSPLDKWNGHKDKDGNYHYHSTTTEEFSPNRRGGGRRPGLPNDPPPPRGEDRPAGDEKGKKNSREQKSPSTSESRSSKNETSFDVSSSSIDSDGMLSVKCTCDGDRESPAVAWKNLPKGTTSLAISLWHTAPDQEKSYWVVYNIPADVEKLAQKSRGVGTLGLNDRRRAEYDPMCSKGPGVKTYHITVFALSQDVKLTASKASRADLLEAVKGITLATTTLDFKYERREVAAARWQGVPTRLRIYRSPFSPW